MADLDEELVLEFKVESQEHLATVEPALLQIEDAGPERQNELLHLIFRAVHSVKGASGFFGLETIQGLSHTMESLLMRVRDGELEHTIEMTDVLLSGLDMLSQMIEELPERLDLDTADVTQTLSALTHSDQVESESTATEAEGADSDPESLDLTIHLSAEQLSDAKRYGKRLFGIFADSPSDFGDDPEDLFQGVADLIWEGETSEGHTLIVASVLDIPLLAGAIDLNESQFAEIPQEDNQDNAEEAESPEEAPASSPAASTEPDAAADQVATPKAETKPAPKKAATTTDPKKAKAEASTAGRRVESNETVRVNVHLLDRLMDQAGELVLSRNQLLRHFTDAPDVSVKGILQDIDLITSELQGDIMNTRMQPVGGVFNKFTRIVRDLSKKLDKQIKLHIEGSEVELDKSIVELLSDPLTHLVRNSLDHGIETPDERSETTKPEVGQVTLRAFHEGGQVHIEIEDDGRGIDPDKMRSVAVSKELMSQADAERLSDAEARMLIFAPGFSTAAQVSDVSGRGVGMDVVKTNIGKLGGKIEIDSELGVGTRLTIALPLTLAIIPSLVVEVGDQRLAIPQVNLVELVRIKRSETEKRISHVSGAPVLKLRGNLLALLSLTELLDIEEVDTPEEIEPPEESSSEEMDASAAPDAMHIVVLQVRGTSFGLVVDDILDSEEIVVKPLSSMLESIPLYSGATIMGDGRVAMILDAHGIADVAALRLEEQKAAMRDLGEEETDSERTKRSLVLFNNAAEEQFAIDLDRLIRLESISPDQLEAVGNDVCIQYLGEGLPLIRLEEHLGVRPIPEDCKQLFVLIPKVEGRPIGLLAGGIVDAVDVEIRLDQKIDEAPGIEGRALIEDRLTLVLDPDKFSVGNERGAAA